MQKSSGPKGQYSRGYLPHLDFSGKTQFLTYRLADSVPNEVIDRYKSRLELGRISEREYHKIIERYLDSGRGECYLGRDDVASIVEENLFHFNGVKYQLHAWVIMPNHLHKLVTPYPDVSLAEIAHSCKSYTAKAANRILNRTGEFWFPEPFDRYIRSGSHFDYVWDYIESNPVKAGLCEFSCEWRYSSAWHNFNSAEKWD